MVKKLLERTHDYESSMIDVQSKEKRVGRAYGSERESLTLLSSLQNLRSGMQGSSKLFQSGQKFVPVIKAHEYSMGLSTTGYYSFLFPSRVTAAKEEGCEDDSRGGESFDKGFSICTECDF